MSEKKEDSVEHDKYLVGRTNGVDRGANETEGVKLLRLGTKSTLIGRVSQRR